MTSFTSDSELPPRWAGLPVAVGLGLAVGVLALGLALVQALAAGVGNPRTALAVQALGRPAPWVVVGNSVALSVVDPGELAAGLGVPPEQLALAGIEGAQGPHVAALLRHQPLAPGVNVVVLMPTHNLLAGELVDAGDRTLLVELLAGPDDALTTLGLGGPVSRAELWAGQRARARDAVLEAVALGAPRWVAARSGVRLPEGGLLAELGAGPAPRELGGGATPGAPAAVAAEPELRAPEDSALPLLAEAVAGVGGTLTVVLPAQRGAAARCVAAPEEAVGVWALAHGVDLVDLRGAPLAAGDFSREHHLHDRARPQASGILAAELRALHAQPRAEQAGRYRNVACPRPDSGPGGGPLR